MIAATGSNSSRRPEVLWLSNETPDRWGQGGQRRQFFQIAALVDAGFQVTVLSLSGPQDASSVSGLAEVQRTTARMRNVIPNPLHYWRRWRISRTRWSGVVVAHTESWPTWASFVQASTSPHVLVDMHNVLSPWHRLEGREREALRWARVEREIADSGADIAVCSTKEQLLLSGNRHEPLVVRHGIDPREWTADPSQTPVAKVKLFGNWGWGPNREGLRWFLDEVWPSLRDEFGVRCEIAGSSVPTHLPGGVSDVGRVSSINVFLSDATAVAVPVINGVGAPVKTAEALASGVPVLSTLDGAADWGHLVACTSDDPGVWVRTMKSITHKPQASRARSMDARRTILTEGTWAITSQPLVDWVKRSGEQR